MKRALSAIVVLFLFVYTAIAGNTGRGSSKEIKAETKSALLVQAKELVAVGQYKKAADVYKKYIAQDPNADIDYYNGVIDLLLRDDKPVEMKNIGRAINSSVDEYSPRITPDGQTLYFTSFDRPGGFGGEDVWVSRKGPDGNWGNAVNFGDKFNTSTHEDILAISNDGSFAIAFGNYLGSFGGGDLFYIYNRGDRWTIPCNLGGSINTKKWEAQAALGPDGKTLLFVSDRAGGQGGSDIWVSTLTENGWTTPKNLGSVINTSNSEYYPFLAADGKTLYFSSMGHPGLGGSDIFVSRRLDDSWTNWSKPVNLGKYINTVNDDYDLAIPASGDIAVIVKNNMADGLGGTDIYYFSLPEDMRPEQVFSISGKVTDEDGKPVAAIIHYYDKKTGEEIAKAVSNSQDGMYSTTLPYGIEYFISIDMRGYLYVSDQLDLRPKKETSARRDYTLQKIKVGLKFELKNIYFDSGKSTLKYESKEELDKLFDIMSRSAIVIELGGHTDNVGSEESNLKLSQDRVDAVKNYLVQKGIPKDRIKAVGYGETVPIADNNTDEGKAKNRRVEVKVTEIIPEKEGGEVVTEEPEKKKEAAKFDILAMLRLAAEIGGLPDDSPCSNEAYFYSDRPEIVKKTTPRPETTPVIYNEYIWKGMNVHLLNYGFNNLDGGFLGVGLNLVGDRDEYYAEYFFSSPEGIKWLAGAGLLYNMSLEWLANLDLNFMYGADIRAYNIEVFSDSKTYFYGNVPLGLRYVHNISGIALAADVIYNLGVFKSEEITSNVSFMKIGVGARWNMLQAGLYVNSGDVVDYFGFRLGVGF